MTDEEEVREFLKTKTKLPIIDGEEQNLLLALSLDYGDALSATETEIQMMIKMTGVSITSKPRADGRFQGYVVRDGKKQYVYGKTRDEVAAKVKALIRDQTPKAKKRGKTAKPAKPPAPTLNAWLDDWLDLYKKPNLKPSSFKTLTSSLTAARNALGDRPIDQITTAELQRFLLSMSAPTQRDMTRACLAQAFEKAVKLGLLAHNPCDALEIKKTATKKRRALTRDEQEKFLSLAKKTKYAALCIFLLQTGLRIGEALALTVGDIDADKKTATVDKNVVFIHGERIVQSSPKSAAGNRTVPIPPQAFDMLCLALDDEPAALVFPFNGHTINRAFVRFSEQLDFTVTPHVLRHTYATRLEEAGISAKMSQYLLGHSSIQMTKDVYTDVQADYVEKTAKTILSAFDTKNKNG